MDDKVFETVVTNAIKIGCINTLSQLGLIAEDVSEKQAHKMYGEKKVKDWRRKRWIVGYPSGNRQRAKFYYRRSELETASRMLDMQNVIPPTLLNRIIEQNGLY
jgi:hypothetical protein